jgi:hypothetical protein
MLLRFNEEPAAYIYANLLKCIPHRHRVIRIDEVKLNNKQRREARARGQDSSEPRVAPKRKYKKLK